MLVSRVSLSLSLSLDPPSRLPRARIARTASLLAMLAIVNASISFAAIVVAMRPFVPSRPSRASVPRVVTNE